MKQSVMIFYRWWRALNRQGLIENTYDGYRKFQRAKAIGLLMAVAPWLPLVVSDEMGITRGAAWYAWSVIAISWGIAIFGIIFWQIGKTVAEFYRNWWSGRK